MSEKGVRQCLAGTVLFREGEEGNRMYVIKSGRVRLTKKIHDSEILVEELEAGEFCGELAMLGSSRRPVTAVVVENAAVIQVQTEQFEDMIRGNTEIALRMLKKLTQRLTEAQYRVSNLTLRTNKARVLHQLRAEVENRHGAEGLTKLAPLPDNVAEVLGIEIGEIKSILSQLVRDELISVKPTGEFKIIEPESFDRYLRYLELHDRYAYN